MTFEQFWERAQKKIPVDFARALTDDLRTGNFDIAVIQEFFQEAISYVPEQARETELAHTFYTDYVIARLYERYGYLEQAKYFRDLANGEIAKLGETLTAGKEAWKPPKSHSETHQFTQEEMSKW